MKTKHTNILFLLSLSLFFSLSVALGKSALTGRNYRAAAVQHAALGTVNDPSNAIRSNIEAYDQYAAKASNASASIIVFNEGGLGMFLASNRDQAKLFCEQYPTEKDHGVIPCDHNDYADRYQVSSLSCLAKKYSLYLVADSCDRVLCSSSDDPNCPSDGAYQYNAQIVFGPKGEYITKYHKVHLFGESNLFDVAKPQPVTFTANFDGTPVTFGLFVCFDIEFPHPALDLINSGIKHFTFSSHWFDLAPAETAVAIQQSFSRKYGINLIAANTADTSGSGSGIYSKGEVLAFAFNPFAPSSSPDFQVMIADLPIDDLSEPLIEEKHNKPIHTHVLRKPHRMPITDEIYRSCWLAYPFIGPRGNCSLVSMVPGSSTSLSASHNSLQCSSSFSLTNSPSSSDEIFALFAYRGTMSFPYTPDPLSLEVCSLLKCVYNQSITTGDIICAPVYHSTVHFSEYHVEAYGLSNTAQLFPLISIDQGALVSPQLSIFNEKATDGIRSAALETNGEVDQQLLFAAVYGVLPNTSK